LADEGDATPQQRLGDLRQYREDLEAALAARPGTGRWRGVFDALSAAIRQHALPAALLHALLDAFEQDVTQHDYADRAQLLDYCRRSANPVGRLLLHLYGIADERSLRQSDAICSALQLANFWQDLSVDTRRGRLYTPLSERTRHGVSAQDLLGGPDTSDVRALVLELVQWTRDLMHQGAELVHRVPGRAGWELRLVVQGGLRVLEKIDAVGGATLSSRPALRWFDAPLLVWRAICMRPHPTPLPNTAT
jgi:squalene synthase HpnC